MSNEIFLIVFLGFIIFMTIGPAACRPLKVPSVIALLIIGMIIGPNGIDMLGHLSRWFSFLGTAEPEVIYQNVDFLVGSLGSLGLIFLMVLAGMEADFKLIAMTKKPVILLSLLTFGMPAVAGYFLYEYFRPNDFAGKLLYASLFASHSVGIVFPVIRELKLSRTRFGASVLISTVITDVASIILLAVAVQTKKLETAGAADLGKKTLSIFDYIDPSIFGEWFTPVFLVTVLLYLAVALWVVSKVAHWVLRRLHPNEDGIVTTFLAMVLITLLIGEFIGVNLVVGAFVAGLGMSKIVQDNKRNHLVFKKMEAVGYGFLIPFLFLTIGMSTDFGLLLESPGNLSIILFTIVGLVGSKVLSGFLAMKLSGFSAAKGLCAGLMTVPQLSATLAAAAIGREMGLLDNNFFNAIVVLSIVTTLPVPTLVRLVIEKGKLTFDTIAPQEENDYSVAAPQDDF